MHWLDSLVVHHTVALLLDSFLADRLDLHSETNCVQTINIHFRPADGVKSTVYLVVHSLDSERVAVAADSHDTAAVVPVPGLDFDFVVDRPVGVAFDSEPVAGVVPGLVVVDAASAVRSVVAAVQSVAAVVAIAVDAPVAMLAAPMAAAHSLAAAAVVAAAAVAAAAVAVIYYNTILIVFDDVNYNARMNDCKLTPVGIGA